MPFACLSCRALAASAKTAREYSKAVRSPGTAQRNSHKEKRYTRTHADVDTRIYEQHNKVNLDPGIRHAQHRTRLPCNEFYTHTSSGIFAASPEQRKFSTLHVYINIYIRLCEDTQRPGIVSECSAVDPHAPVLVKTLLPKNDR